jgi:hypothetical protein
MGDNDRGEYYFEQALQKLSMGNDSEVIIHYALGNVKASIEMCSKEFNAMILIIYHLLYQSKNNIILSIF